MSGKSKKELMEEVLPSTAASSKASEAPVTQEAKVEDETAPDSDPPPAPSTASVRNVELAKTASEIKAVPSKLAASKAASKAPSKLAVVVEGEDVGTEGGIGKEEVPSIAASTHVPGPQGSKVTFDTQGNNLYENDGGWVLEKMPKDMLAGLAPPSKKSKKGKKGKKEKGRAVTATPSAVQEEKIELNPRKKCCLDKPGEPMTFARNVKAIYDTLSGREAYPCNECDRPVCQESMWHWFSSLVTDMVDTAKNLTTRPLTATKGCGSMDSDTLRNNTKGTYAALEEQEVPGPILAVEQSSTSTAAEVSNVNSTQTMGGQGGSPPSAPKSEGNEAEVSEAKAASVEGQAGQDGNVDLGKAASNVPISLSNKEIGSTPSKNLNQDKGGADEVDSGGGAGADPVTIVEDSSKSEGGEGGSADPAASVEGQAGQDGNVDLGKATSNVPISLSSKEIGSTPSKNLNQDKGGADEVGSGGGAEADPVTIVEDSSKSEGGEGGSADPKAEEMAIEIELVESETKNDDSPQPDASQPAASSSEKPGSHVQSMIKLYEAKDKTSTGVEASKSKTEAGGAPLEEPARETGPPDPRDSKRAFMIQNGMDPVDLPEDLKKKKKK